VTSDRSRSFGRRALSVAVCYVLILQAFLGAFGTAFAAARIGAPEAVICHGADGAAPAPGDSGRSAKLPCVLCATAAAGGGVLPDSIPIAATLPPVASRVGFAQVVTILIPPPARAGLSRAPPSFG
jgi:hypothetical protein